MSALAPWADRQSPLEDWRSAGDGSRNADGPTRWRPRSGRQPAAPGADGATSGPRVELARVARRPGARGVRAGRRAGAVDPPASCSRPRTRWSAHRRVHGHVLWKVSVLPAPRVAGDRGDPWAEGAARGRRLV